MKLPFYQIQKGRKFPWMIVLILILLATGCRNCSWFCPDPPTPGDKIKPTMRGEAEAGISYVWLTAKMDAFVSCSDNIPCSDGDQSFVNRFDLQISQSNSAVNEVHTFIQFYIPEFPEGIYVEEAYINIYENSRHYPGNQGPDIIEVSSPWDEDITWNNQPGGQGGLYQLGTFRDINKWVPQYPQMATDVNRILQNPANHHGYMIDNSVFVASPAPKFLRSFSSNRNRTNDDMAPAPRLLLKVISEVPLNENTIKLPDLPDDATDLDDFMSGDVVMVEVANGVDWPAHWNVAR